jgi:hypothetical protein
MASQQGDVDWFDFWLNGHEDPDPTKADQYIRWRELRNLQEENEKKSRAQPTDTLSRKCHAKRGKAQQTANKS